MAIDDFGTGYSSLSHLKHFPIDTLKIDISFIADLETDRAMRRSPRRSSRWRAALNLRVVAEGVGTSGQLAFLEARDCHCFQGFLFSEAMAPDEFTEFAARHK